MLEELTKQIASVFHPKKIILFGSNAWGEPSNDSDFDLFVIMDTKEERKAKRAINILNTCHPGTFAIDLLVRTPKEVEERINMGDSFIIKIIKEGKVLYDATREGMD